MAEKIKILHINISDGIGGAAIAAYRLHFLMNQDKRFDSKMLVLIKKTDKDLIFHLNNFSKLYAKIPNLLNNLIGKWKKTYGSFSLALSGNNISKNKLVQQTDIIYIHWVNSGMMSWRNINQLFKLNKPIFLFCHDMWYFTGGCHVSGECTNYETNCDACLFFEKKIIQRHIKHQYFAKKHSYNQHANVDIILPSYDYFTKARTSNIIDLSRIHFIPNILDINKFVPKEDERKNSKIHILYGALGGKTNPYKGWDDFLYMAIEISNIYKDKIEFAIFGYNHSPEEINEIPFKFIDYGVITEERKIIEIYQNADVFIFPSHQESFGQTLVEAMSCGVVPISYKVGIAEYLIENEKNGYLNDLGDKNGLVTSFHKVMKSDILSLKKNARQIIHDKLSIQLLLDMHNRLL